jgi:hypothetical protein
MSYDSFAEHDSRDNKRRGSSCTKNNTDRKAAAVRNINRGKARYVACTR